MASNKQAQLLANLVREHFMLSRVADITDVPEYDIQHDAALRLDSRDASTQITQLQAEIKDLRSRHSITRWISSDPLWRDASGSQTS